MESSKQCSDKNSGDEEEDLPSSFFVKTAKSLVMQPMFKCTVVPSKKGKGSYKRFKKVKLDE